jgi:hypothetical protein
MAPTLAAALDAAALSCDRIDAARRASARIRELVAASHPSAAQAIDFDQLTAIIGQEFLPLFMRSY